MTQPTKPKKKRERERPDELDEEPPMTPERARRELGWDLLPFNGGDREDFDNG